MEYAQERGFAFMETSALNATHVHEAFSTIVDGEFPSLDSMNQPILVLYSILLPPPACCLAAVEMYQRRRKLIAEHNQQILPPGRIVVGPNDQVVPKNQCC
jgi:hypothetical protein